MPSRWIMMRGYPGSGKSTLADALERTGRQWGLVVDRFGEEELFSRSEFSDVAEGFRTPSSAFQTTSAGAVMFVDAYRRYLQNVDADWLVWDWSAIGMVHDLAWAADPVVLRRYLAEVLALVPAGTLRILALQADPEIGVARAAAERGEEWVRRYVELAVDQGLSGATDKEHIVAYVRRTESIDGAFALAEREGWPASKRLDATQEGDHVLGAALAALG